MSGPHRMSGDRIGRTLVSQPPAVPTATTQWSRSTSAWSALSCIIWTTRMAGSPRCESVADICLARGSLLFFFTVLQRGVCIKGVHKVGWVL